ncbi:MAG: hypothetical protein ACFKPT_04695 [Gloeotrichia echinulata GP01]
MKVAVKQQDLQVLGKTLHEQLLAEVPSGEFLQVKCALNNDELMILTQHPVAVTVDTQIIFQVLEEALQMLPTPGYGRVQCFVRISGEKLPYAKQDLNCSIRENDQARLDSPDEEEISFHTTQDLNSRVRENYQDDRPNEPDEGEISFPPLTYSASIDETAQEQGFDPLAGTPDLLTVKSSRPLKPIVLGVGLAGIVVLAIGAYLATRPCVLSECKEIQAAQQLKTQSRQLMRQAKSEKELLAVQEQLETTSLALTTIPPWSPHHQPGEELQASLSAQAEKINQVIKALQAASLAVQKTQTPANSLQELQARQKLWRQTIAPLEAIAPNSEVYKLVQGKLLYYRIKLQGTNQQVHAAEKWLKKLSAAKDVANAATKQEATAKSLNDWQKVKSTWQVVINALNVIPQTSSGYQEAQNLLIQYKPKLAIARHRVTQEQLSAKTYQQAMTTANQAKAFEQKKQWQAAVTYWGQAVQRIKQISRDSLYYNQAQTLIQPYSAALKQAQEKLDVFNSLQQTHRDLTNTCTNLIRICTFTIDSQGITVQLTPEYDQARQSNLPNSNATNPSNIDGSHHLQILQEALGVISDNANLSLAVYDSQGQPIYTRSLTAQ